MTARTLSRGTDRSATDCEAAVDVVIVNWNSADWLRRCMTSLDVYGQGAIDRVTVVDNASEDGSERVALASAPLEVLRLDRNLGFGSGCNLGARAGSAKYLLFLNPDAALQDGTLQRAVECMEMAQAADVGVCGVKLLDEDGTVQKHCARFPSASSFIAMALGLPTLLPNRFRSLHELDFDHLSNRDVDHVIGAFYLIRRELFEQLGGFDERFFVYLEDLDLSRRVRAYGHRVHYLADAVGFHKGGGTSDRVKAMRLCYSLESRIAYSFKHFALPAAWAVAMATLTVEPIPRLVRAVLRGSPIEAKDTCVGFLHLWWRSARRLFDGMRSSPSNAASRSAQVERARTSR